MASCKKLLQVGRTLAEENSPGVMTSHAGRLH